MEEKEKKYFKDHKSIKNDIEEWFKFFKDNIIRYKQSMRFAFKDTLTDRDREVLRITEKPELQINYIQPYLTRFLGELSKQSPDIEVTGNGSEQDINLETVEIVEGHIRDVFDQFKKKGYKNQVLKEQCGGGYSVLEVGADYRNNHSFDMMLYVKKSDDPTMCFFDPKAKLPSKSDGEYCGKLFPMTFSLFKNKYPNHAKKLENTKFYNKTTGSEYAPFHWSYKNMSVDVVVVAEIFYVKEKNFNLFKLSDGSTMSESEYNEMIKDWRNLEPPPVVIKKRKPPKKSIIRMVVFGEDIIEEEETSLPGLPFVFVECKSAFVYKDDQSSQVEQVIQSYIYNSMDLQRLLNSTAQTIANFSENLMQQKYILDERAIVDQDSWSRPQIASLLIKRSIDDEGREIPNPNQPVHQEDIPQSIMSLFGSMQNMMQNTFGSYDASLGINGNNISGRAMNIGAVQSDSASSQPKDGFTDAMNTVAELLIKMIPVYYVTPMTIPFFSSEGERSYIKINQIGQDGTIDRNYPVIDYGENDLGVNVTAGYSLSTQRENALKMIMQLMNVSQTFKSAMESKGMPVLLDSFENVKGIDEIKNIVKDQIEQQNNQPQQPNPIEQQLMIKQQELAIKQKNSQIDAQLKLKELSIKEHQLELEKQLALLRYEQQMANDAVQHEKVQAEIDTHHMDNATKIAETALRHNDQLHRHTMDVMGAVR